MASAKAILPWLLTFVPLAKILYKALDLASVADFAAGLGGNPNMKALLDFATSGAGSLVAMVLGLAWLTFLVLRKPKKQTSETEKALSVSEQKIERIQINSLKEELATANSLNHDLTQQNTKLSGELAHQTKLRESREQSLEISRREVGEVRAEADAQTRTYDVTFKGLKEEMDALKQKAETANLRADTEATDKAFIRELKERAESQLANLDFLYDLAKEQAQDISAHVKASPAIYPHPGELQLTGDDLCILLGLIITNESVFTVSIEDKEITGHFSLNGVAFKENAGQLIDSFRSPLHGLKPKQQEILILEQPLRQFEAEKIQRCLTNDEAKLVINTLRIPISANNPAMRVEPRPLRLGNGEVLLRNFKRNTDNA